VCMCVCVRKREKKGDVAKRSPRFYIAQRAVRLVPFGVCRVRMWVVCSQLCSGAAEPAFLNIDGLFTHQVACQPPRSLLCRAETRLHNIPVVIMMKPEERRL